MLVRKTDPLTSALAASAFIPPAKFCTAPETLQASGAGKADYQRARQAPTWVDSAAIAAESVAAAESAEGESAVPASPPHRH
jgi:hypothetical protein